MTDLLNIEKPTNETEFKTWLMSVHGYNIDEQYEYYYNTVVKKIKTDFEESNYWKGILKELPEINDKYFIKKKVHLLTISTTPIIHTKSLNSLIIKAFRKNILNNKNFPEPPNNGWITPENWFERINDIIRTTITVKYLDGVEFIIDEIEKITSDYNYDFSSSLEAREEGYYAAHAEIIMPLSMPSENFSPIEKNLTIEVQVTTEIQEIIKTLLHKHYEENRKTTVPKDYKWQWDYKSPEFTSNYLGHIIHYVEGMIVEIRDKEK